jgi:hypothetical protein
MTLFSMRHTSTKLFMRRPGYLGPPKRKCSACKRKINKHDIAFRVGDSRYRCFWCQKRATS